MMNDPGPSAVDRSAGTGSVALANGSQPAMPAWADALASASGDAAQRLELSRQRFEAALEAAREQPSPGSESELRTSLQDVVDLLATALQHRGSQPPVVTVGGRDGNASRVRAAWTGSGLEVTVDGARLGTVTTPPGALAASASGASGPSAATAFILNATPVAVALPANLAEAGAGPSVAPGPAQVAASSGTSVAAFGEVAIESLAGGLVPAAVAELSDASGATERLFAQAAGESAQALAARWIPGVPDLQPTAASPAGPADKVWQQVEAAATRMQVTPSLAGGQQVRLDIDPRLLPGVQVVLQFTSGRLQMDFICSQEASRRRLRAVAGRELGGAAGRLGVDVLMSLRSDAQDEAGTEFMHAAA